MTNIFICLTPLHALIAEKILELEKINNFILIYYYEEDNAKHQYYFNKLANKAKRAFYLHKDNRILSLLKIFVSLFFKLKRNDTVNVYAGNIKTIYTRMVIFLSGFKNLYSFDDGLGNVCGEGYLYEGRNPGIVSRLLSSAGIYFTYASITGKIKKHFTIYTLENIMPNPFHISLFDDGATKNKTRQKETVVLLTSPFYEYKILDIDEEKLLYKRIIEKFNVFYVIPHPAEQQQKIEMDGIEIIRSEKIAEEILLDMKQEYKKIRVLGIYSSALLNLNGIEGIEIVNIHYDLHVSYKKMRQLFSSIDIKTVLMDD